MPELCLFLSKNGSMAKDLFHEVVKVALQKEGWTITHDPYTLKALKRRFSIDLGAERVFAAQRGKETIAVEVKSFLNASPIYDFHLALGQYMNYLRVLRQNEPERTLFVAIPLDAYNSFFIEADVWQAVEDFAMSIIVFDDQKQEIIHWFTF